MSELVSVSGSCPSCGTEISKAIARGPSRAPVPGDFVVCFCCRAPSKVSATGLTALSDAERAQYQQLARERWA